VRPDPIGLLASGLLAATAFLQVPAALFRASAQDVGSPPTDLALAALAAALLSFALLALPLALVPHGAARRAGAALGFLAAYGWLRSAAFPGPSVNLDGAAVAADLSTGPLGLLVPLTGGAVVAGLALRRRRIAGVLLGGLLAGSLVQSVADAARGARAVSRNPGAGAAALLEWSREGNVLVLVLDSLQSDVLEDALAAEPRLREALDGFRHYRLASSNGPTTYLSLPTIHSGSPYQPGQSAAEFYREAVKEGSVLNRLARAGYRTSYAVAVGDCPSAVLGCTGTAALATSRPEAVLAELAPLVDLGLYRVCPDGAREAILRGGRGPFALLRGRAHAVGSLESELAALRRLAAESRATGSRRTAKMVHSMATHPPAVLQADCSAGERRDDRVGALLQATCVLSWVGALLDRLRSEGVYDVTDVAIVSDHGYGFESRYAEASQDPKFRRMVGALNPVVLVKPAGTRGPLRVSDAPVTLGDVPRALCGATDCAPSEGLDRLDTVDPDRRRTAFWYTWNHRYWSLPHVPGLVAYSIRGDLPRIPSWSRDAAEYFPGAVIDFRRGGNLGRYVGFGWGRRQDEHTAMADPEATLWLRLTLEPGHDLEMEMEMEMEAAAIGGSPGAPVRVKVEVNGERIGEVATGARGGFERLRLTLPAHALARSVATTIAFLAGRDASGTAGDDQGHLALRSLVLRAGPRGKAQLPRAPAK
jgi:hypothetical protein